jgi:hypothetical protein
VNPSAPCPGGWGRRRVVGVPGGTTVAMRMASEARSLSIGSVHGLAPGSSRRAANDPDWTSRPTGYRRGCVDDIVRTLSEKGCVLVVIDDDSDPFRILTGDSGSAGAIAAGHLLLLHRARKRPDGPQPLAASGFRGGNNSRLERRAVVAELPRGLGPAGSSPAHSSAPPNHPDRYRAAPSSG